MFDMPLNETKPNKLHGERILKNVKLFGIIHENKNKNNNICLCGYHDNVSNGKCFSKIRCIADNASKESGHFKELTEKRALKPFLI